MVGVCWLGACSFPDYRFLPDEPEPIPIASVCTDGMPSDAETGIDCGGGCPRCGMGETCERHEDCESDACVDAICQQPSCTDLVKNGSETDIDCGGQCDPCPPGNDCGSNKDCADGVCAQQCIDGVCAEGFCQFPTCTDNVHNGEETDVDCGATCTPCALGLACNQGSDCASMHCSGELCVSPGCTDGAFNGEETDLDCGGPGCGPCDAGKDCELDSDCLSTVCDNLECSDASCTDSVQNGDESAVDCGGTRCDGCPNLSPCDDAGDCAGGACQSGLCVPAVATGMALSRVGWIATASDNYADDDANEVLDDVGNRWTSGTHMYDGMWFQVDMGEVRTFFSAELHSGEFPLDVPPTYDFYLSVDGTFGEPAKAGLFGAEYSTVSFDTAQVARYLRWVVRATSTKWWSMETLNVYE